MQRVLDWRRAIGMVSGAMRAFTVRELSPRLASLSVRFEFQDRNQAPLYDFSGVYTLVRKPDGWRIAALAHNQNPRLLACVKSRRPGAPPA